ncbi:MAG: SRPBCC family protein [Actinomycetota bacterium]
MSGRAKAQLSVVVNRKPDEVFAYLSDVRKHAEWSPKAYRVEGVDGPVQMGSTFTSYGWVPKDKDHRNDVEVTAFDAPRRIEFSGREKGENFLSTYVLTPQGDGTKVEKRLDMPKPPGVAGALFPLILGGLIKPGTNKGMKMLKARLEGGE